jgi:hypothetical protein
MRGGFRVLLTIVLLLCAEQAWAQASIGSAPTNANVWQDGTTGVPGVNSSRQLPDNQPSTRAQPAGAQPVAVPTWYQQVTGIPLAGGRFYADATFGSFYDDNIFATKSDRQHDYAIFERPALAWVTQGQNYTVSVDGYAEGREYVRFRSEDQVNGGTGTNFTYMPDNDTQIIGGLRYLHQHLDRGSSQTVVTVPGFPSLLLSTLFSNPVAYDEGIQSIALNKRYGKLWSSVGASALEVQYQNATIGSFGPLGFSPFAGEVVNFNYADGVIAAVNGRLGYVVLPQTSMFVEVAGNTRDWGVNYFNSNGFRAVGGFLFELARLRGEIWGGYMNQQYIGSSMKSVSSWTYGVGLVSPITDTLSAVVEGRREAKESALGLAQLSPSELGVTSTTCTLDIAVCVSDIESQIGGRLDYRILPKVVVGVGVTYLEDDYQGAFALGRIDRTVGPIAALKYFATPNITMGFDYRNVTFSSSAGTGAAPVTTSVAALPYFRDIYMLWLNAKLSSQDSRPVVTK